MATYDLDKQSEYHGKILACWNIPEFDKPKRGIAWYIITFLIVSGLIIWSILTSNFLFTLLVILFFFIIVSYGRKEPKQLPFQINEDGIKLAEKFYPWKSLNEFWLIYEPPTVKRIYITAKNKLTPLLSIPLQTEDPIKIRQILLNYLSEDLNQENESTTDVLNRWLKL